MTECTFCQIVKDKAPCHKVWEDDHHLAFLSIFPNTEGVTVVIPKKHYPSYAFNLPDDVLTRLILAVKIVAGKIDNAFKDVGRTALVFEGFKVDHVHAKLFPLHGTRMINWKHIDSNVDNYFKKYEGYISSHDWKRRDDKVLARIAEKISLSNSRI
jgi:diadenosine tetraphosphate (Ap4A) HIT family hydrolase